MIKENPEFLALLNKCYDLGVLREVFRSERAIVCNVFNQTYLAFPLVVVADQHEGNYPGFAMNSHGLKCIVEDDRFVLEYYRHLDDADRDRVLIVFNEDLLNFWLKKKEEFEKRPPHEKMDLEYERQILENPPKPREKGFFRRLKEKLF